LRYPLTDILASAAAVRVLRTLFASQGSLTASQLAGETRLSRPGVHSTLEILIGQQMVKVQGAARSRLYAIDLAHPFAQALGQLFAAEHERYETLMANLRDSLRAIPGVRAAWLYGSVARGEDTSRSDLDIALVVTDPEITVPKAKASLAPLEERHCIRLSLVDLQDADIVRLIQEEAAWWQEVVRDARVLVGQRPEHYASSLKRQDAPK
jgi:predicted nucleotidyltransferase